MNSDPAAIGPVTSGAAALVDEYCKSLGGTRPIHSVLIANNGIAAVKFINSVRSWAFETFGQERAIQIVAMATPEDMRANAEHIRMADALVEVPGGTNNNNYANVQLIVEVAERTKVDAVWPGWGHASENPDLPASLKEKGFAFLGPPAEAMAALGDKIGSSLIAQAAKVPTIPWSGSEVELPADQGRDIPDDLYKKACVYTVEEAVECTNRIGLPVMFKASWGGGGKGIRKVMNAEEVPMLFKQVQGEVPGSPIFVMKMVTQSRHLEVQLVCDAYGNVAALHSRDCSVQRRHQKIVEEGPVTIAPREVVHELEQGARRLAKIVGYSGVATVEYLYSMVHGNYFFLEVNPRLQVEHPVTEWIAGVNLPATQLSVAMGIPLWHLPEIRRFYGIEGGGLASEWRQCIDVKPFDFDKAVNSKPKGHVVAVRVTSESPDDGFKPTSGRVQELAFRSKPDVWAYFSIKSGGQIHEYSDSQFGHLFAFGADRRAAIANMVIALRAVHIRGEIHTNVDYTTDLIQDKEYVGNEIHTGWLDSRIARRIKAQRPPMHISVVTGALYKAARITAGRVSEYLSFLEKGQIPPVSVSLLNVEVTINLDNTKYTLNMVKRSPSGFSITIGDREFMAEAHTLRDGGLLCQLDGNSHVVYGEEEAAGTRLLIGGKPCLLQNEYDPSQLKAESSCKLMRYLVEDGGHLKVDEPYAEVEVMKMCMPLLAPAAGTLHWCMPEGQAMLAGDLIGTLDIDDPSAFGDLAKPFTGEFPLLGPPTPVPERAHQQFAEALKKAQLVLAGYQHNVPEVVGAIVKGMFDDSVPLLQWQEIFAVLCNRLPKILKEKLETIHDGSRGPNYFAAPACKQAIREFLDSLPEKDRLSQEQLVGPLLRVAELHAGGRDHFVHSVVEELLQQYLKNELLFSQKAQSDVIESLRQTYKKDLSLVVDAVLSHQGIARKNELIVSLMDKLVSLRPQEHRATLHELATLSVDKYQQVLVKAKQLLEQIRLEELQAGVVHNLRSLDAAAPASDPASSTAEQAVSSEAAATSATRELLEARMDRLVDTTVAIDDALTTLFDYDDVSVQKRAIEAYVRRLYQAYIVKDSVTVVTGANKSVTVTWQFWEENPPPSIEVLEEEEASLSDAVTVSQSTYNTNATRGVKRWGVMVAAASLEEAKALLQPVLEEPDGWKLAFAKEGGGGGGEGVGGGSSLGGMGRTSSLEDLPFGGMKRIRTFVGIPYGAGNVVHVALLPAKTEGLTQGTTEDRIAALRSALLDPTATGMMRHAGVTAVSCILVQPGGVPGKAPLRNCFHWTQERDTFDEWPLLRHVEPPLSDLLELQKLMKFGEMAYKRSRNRNWHIYYAVEKPTNIRRLFLRSVIRLPRPDESDLPPSHKLNGIPAAAAGATQIDITARTISEAILEAMEEPELETKLKAEHTHIFMAVLGSLTINTCASEASSVKEVHAMLAELGRKVDAQVAFRMRRISLWMWEARVKVTGAANASGAWRLVVENPSGYAPLVNSYREAGDEVKHNFVYFSSPPKGAILRAAEAAGVDKGEDLPPPAMPVGAAASLLAAHSPVTQGIFKGQGPLHGTPLLGPYSAVSPVDKRRIAARKFGTTFCYDFITIFDESLRATWKAAEASGLAFFPDVPLLQCRELVFADSAPSWASQLVESSRPAGMNTIGMVGFKLLLRTPEFPDGRPIYIVANDVTKGAGAFGILEDVYFKAITDIATKQRVPLIYLAANSGARIGIAEEVKKLLQVSWMDPAAPERGFNYLYLTPEDYRQVASSVVAHEVTDEASGEKRWAITDIIGREEGLGVENLSGSGAIASAFSRAYRETFTLTFVTGRTVGIGAYLARLGQRCIQRLDQPIILTGFSALNKLLGREVYSSHMQLGGPKVMAVNGVVHTTVANDYDGVTDILRWISYLPAAVNLPLPIARTSDPIDRQVEYLPVTSCDPRAAIAGTRHDDTFLRGLFDEGSFMEVLEGWAKTVVVGRARLGGIPVGVIAVETQTVLQQIPADPGQPDSQERVLPQAGQVWYPNSALKTAQALLDFRLEGLPLFILANWRGFSGGQHDLFEGVLQAGSLIVDNLRTYDQPAFVYIPRKGELRGGAWVVVDQKINPGMVEMYADDTARGAVLEPEGVVEIKFRRPEILAAMHRLDGQLKAISGQAKGETDPARLEVLKAQVVEREKKLFPVYMQMAVKFAELHDTPRRMKATHAIREIVPWQGARGYFFTRLARRVALDSLSRALIRRVPGLEKAEANAVVQRWFGEENGGGEDKWGEDGLVEKWAKEAAKKEEVVARKAQGVLVSRLAGALGGASGESVAEEIGALIKALPEDARKALVAKIGSFA